MKRVALAALVALVLPNPPVALNVEPPPNAVVRPVEEDEPGFDCRTMGNLTCSPSYILRSGVMVK